MCLAILARNPVSVAFAAMPPAADFPAWASLLPYTEGIQLLHGFRGSVEGRASEAVSDHWFFGHTAWVKENMDKVGPNVYNADGAPIRVLHVHTHIWYHADHALGWVQLLKMSRESPYTIQTMTQSAFETAVAKMPYLPENVRAAGG